MDKKFGEKMYKTIVINGMDIYKNLYENPALAHLKRQEFTELYNKLTEEEKCIYYDNIRRYFNIILFETMIMLYCKPKPESSRGVKQECIFNTMKVQSII